MKTMNSEYLRVALIGCGQFSRAHIAALKEIRNVRLVAVVDVDLARAKDLILTNNAITAYDDSKAMLRQEHPDVVHILTPPNTHAAIAIECMQSGCHVIVEKPMAISTEEAEQMIDVARERGVILATNHNYLFNPCVLKARHLIERGDVGDIVYVNSFYGLSDAGSSYKDISGRSHWAWRLPGSAFTNFLPHLIYLQQAFLGNHVKVSGITLNHHGYGKLPTELNVLLQGEKASGIMAFSMSAKPYTKYIDIYGTKGIIHADLATEVCTQHKKHRLPGMINKVLFNLEESAQLAFGTIINTTKVFLGHIRSNPGLLNHMKEYYSNLQNDKKIPVTGEDGRKMLGVMEQVWSNIEKIPVPVDASLTQRVAPRPQTEAEWKLTEIGLHGKVLVTGATGFLGHHLISALNRCGVRPIALVHSKDRISSELTQWAEIKYGDLCDPRTIENAMKDVNIVYHCAAITKNNVSWEKHDAVNIKGSEIVFRAALNAKAKHVIYTSSVVVYGVNNAPRNKIISESRPFSPNTDKWAYYLRSKREADNLALSYFKEMGLPVTILRLGILYGPGGKPIGRGFVQLGPFCFGIGFQSNLLPFTYVGNAVDSLLLAATTPVAIGQIYNVVDEPQVRRRDAIKTIDMIIGENSILIPIPKILFSAVAHLLERRSGRTFNQNPPKLSNFVIRSACRSIRYDTRKVNEQLGWKSEVTLEEGLRKTFLQK